MGNKGIKSCLARKEEQEGKNSPPPPKTAPRQVGFGFTAFHIAFPTHFALFLKGLIMPMLPKKHAVVTVVLLACFPESCCELKARPVSFK